MGDQIPERYEPQEPAPTYDWDFDSERRQGPKILWGRVVALGALLILAFILGRATGGGGGGDSAELANAEDTIEELQQENDSLREQLSAQPQPTTSPAADETPGGDAVDESENYTVQKGDNLRSIAEDFYADVGLDDCIARANDITDPTQLSVGQELIIPPEEDC
ncbi:MAG: LysM peptidoglycan-binding domain-containing protein [Actinomycetota bacterium]